MFGKERVPEIPEETLWSMKELYPHSDGTGYPFPEPVQLRSDRFVGSAAPESFRRVTGGGELHRLHWKA